MEMTQELWMTVHKGTRVKVLHANVIAHSSFCGLRMICPAVPDAECLPSLLQLKKRKKKFQYIFLKENGSIRSKEEFQVYMVGFVSLVAQTVKNPPTMQEI